MLGYGVMMWRRLFLLGLLPVPALAETGTARWYGARHHGRRTASGEVFDRNGMTAAHRTLPLGTRVRVTNLANNRSVEVRINDRCGCRGTLIDLSEGAARAIGISGTARVRMDRL
jgi:rare lipoprotein A